MYNKAVMVVDDDVDVVEYLAILLRSQGLAVLKAHNAEGALHLVKSLKPDLFLVDGGMSGLDGFELCRRLRSNQHTADTPVIIFSAQNTSRSRRQAFASGADAFLSQADLPHKLNHQVRTLLKNHFQEAHS